jgi:hypothetical protein
MKGKIKMISKESKIPNSCSECGFEKPFPHPQNVHYATHCEKLYSYDNLGDGYMKCIKRVERSIKRLDDCPLQ